MVEQHFLGFVRLGYLMDTGLDVTMSGTNTSEIIWFE